MPIQAILEQKFTLLVVFDDKNKQESLAGAKRATALHVYEGP